MDNHNQELVKEIRDRIQFLITIYILFSTAIYGFYKAIGSNELLSNSNASAIIVGVVSYIIIYLLVGTLIQLESRFLKVLKNLINTNLLLLVVPLIVVSMTLSSNLPSYYEWPFKISLWGVFWLPILVLGVAMLFRAWGNPFKRK